MPDNRREACARAGPRCRTGSTRCLFAAALLVISGAGATGHEDPTWYTVEIIVFENLEPDPGDEIWPEAPGMPALAGSVELTEPLATSEDSTAATPYAYAPLPSREWSLGRLFRRLKRSSRYHPLLHVAWRQPGLGRTGSRPVHLNSGGRDLSAAGPWVEGTVHVWRERYLHLDADLLFAPEVTGAARPPREPERSGNEEKSEADRRTATPSPLPDIAPRFRLRAHRRMRSRQLNYIDHPMFGLLVEITPYEPPENEPPAAPLRGRASAPAGNVSAPARSPEERKRDQ